MGEEEDSILQMPTLPFDRTLQQAILAIKKGAQLLKCGRRGKPKFCPFRLSTDEKFLIWYSGQDEKQLRLISVNTIVRGQRTANFQRQLQPDREQQSFSLIYANGERSLDLICKDEAQAETWFVGLRAVISRCHLTRPFSSMRSRTGAQSCISSPGGYIRRRHNLGLVEDATEFSQVYSVCGSPSQSLSMRCFSDGLSYYSESIYSSDSSLSLVQNTKDVSTPHSPCIEPYNFDKWQSEVGTKSEKNASDRFVAPTYLSATMENNEILKDVLIWGEGIIGGSLSGATDRTPSNNCMQVDSFLPKLLESTMMLDVQNIALGAKFAALVTRQGDVFTWGDGKGGRLGHKVSMDVSHPKLVESLSAVSVHSVACGEYHTCALAQTGELYTWGDCAINAEIAGEMKSSHWLPQKFSGPLDGVSVLSVACGDWHTAIVSTSGQLFTHGDGTFGVLGHGNLESVSQPKEVESLKGLRVKSVACGPWHTAAIVEIMVDHHKFNAPGGKLFTWGDGDKGKLGHVDGERRFLPTCVSQLVDYDFVQVSCGRTLTVALTSMGKVYTMGSAVHGQLGNPQAKDKSITLVEGILKQEYVKKVSSGSFHVAVLTSSGAVYTWGKGTNGQLGLGDSQDRNLPTFVEALTARNVESISCGSNLTAAICLHKSISSTDQSTCSGCKTPFGFTRKKHNCYNCGLQFCRACSSKRAANASLAPNKSRLCRVCDPCFTRLQKGTQSTMPLKLENQSPRQLQTHQRTLSDIKEGRGDVTPSRGQSLSSKLEPLPSLSSALPRWGQVSRPTSFDMFSSERLSPSILHSNQSLTVQSPCSVKTLAISECNVPSSMRTDNAGLFESNQLLSEEIKRLRAEVKNLEERCQVRDRKIQECQKQVEEAWSLAREEATKCKAAKDVIQALALRVHTMSEKVSVGREKNAGVTSNLHQIVPLNTADGAIVPAVEGGQPGLAPTNQPAVAANNQPLMVKLPKDRQADSLSESPFLFSASLKSKYGRELQHNNDKTEDTHAKNVEPWQNETKESQQEWVEQYESGVYITFTSLPDGQKGLKRVRFSRKRFSEKEAEKWWEANQALVYKSYGLEGYSNSSQKSFKG